MRLRLAALTLAVSLGIVGLASAQGPTDWVKSWFTTTPAKSEPAKKLDDKTNPTPMPDAVIKARALRAKADLDRRQEVCMKLIDIALATGDEDLRRMAETLDQRAVDLYFVAKNQSGTINRSTSSPDAKKGGK